MRRLWRIWAKALGEKASNDDGEADIIAFVRTSIVLVYIITHFAWDSRISVSLCISAFSN